MKKFIAKKIISGVSKKFKGVQKLPAQKTPTRFTSVMGEATIKANQRKVLGDVPEFMGLSSRATGSLAAESLALRTANKKFFSSLKTGLKRSRSRTATGIKTARLTKPVSKPAVFKAKNKGAMKAYTAANVKSESVFRNTIEKFTGRSKLSPFSMKTKAAKKPLRAGTKLRREGDRIIDYQKKLMKDMGF